MKEQIHRLPPRRLRNFGRIATSLILAACNTSGGPPPRSENPDTTPRPNPTATLKPTDAPIIDPNLEPDSPTQGVLGASTQIIEVGLPFEGLGRYTGGPHNHRLGIREAAGNLLLTSTDWAPPEITPCATDRNGVATVANLDPDWKVISPIEGEVEKKLDPGFITIANSETGVSTTLWHVDLDNELAVGDPIQKGQDIARAACVGRTNGAHVDVSFELNGGPVSAENVIFDGWNPQEDSQRLNYQGTLLKEGEEARTAEARVCIPTEERQEPCGPGVRNDVLAGGTELNLENLSPLEQARYTFVNQVIGGLVSHQELLHSQYYDSSTNLLTGVYIQNNEELNRAMRILALGEEVEDLGFDLIFKSYHPEEGKSDGEVNVARVLFKNLKVTTAREDALGSADTANGVRWRGSFELSGLVSFGIKKFYLTEGERVEDIEEWINTLTGDEVQSFTDWHELTPRSFFAEPPLAIGANLEIREGNENFPWTLQNFEWEGIRYLYAEDYFVEVFDLMGLSDPFRGGIESPEDIFVKIGDNSGYEIEEVDLP